MAVGVWVWVSLVVGSFNLFVYSSDWMLLGDRGCVCKCTVPNTVT